MGPSFSSKEQATFNFMDTVTISSDFGAQENKISHYFPIYLPGSDGIKCMILDIWMLSFKPTFSLSFLTFIKSLFSSSHSAISQGYILSPCLFKLHAEYIMQNAKVNKAQAGIKIARRNINNLRYADVN